MRYYNLLFFGLMCLAEKSIHREIAQYVAAWAMALIIEINVILIVGVFGKGEGILKAYILIPQYLLLIYLAVQHYKKNVTAFDKLKKKHAAVSDKNSNISFPEGFALFFIFESVLLPFLLF